MRELVVCRSSRCAAMSRLGSGVRKFREISCGIFPEISGKITVLFRNNSAKKFPEICGRKFHETLMQLQHSNALWCVHALMVALLSLLAYLFVMFRVAGGRFWVTGGGFCVKMPSWSCGVNTGIGGDCWGSSIIGALGVVALSNGSVTTGWCNGRTSGISSPVLRAEREWNPSLPGAGSAILFRSVLRTELLSNIQLMNETILHFVSKA